MSTTTDTDRATDTDTAEPDTESPRADTKPAAPSSSESEVAEPDSLKLPFALDTRARSRAVAAAMVVLLAVAGFCGYRWHTDATRLDDISTQAADRAHAEQMAGDYTVRSLTYDHRNLAPFFESVRKDAAKPLQDRYNQVQDTLSKIMAESQVVATGQVQGTSIESANGDEYKVVVFATQNVQNVQQKEPAKVPNLLRVTITRSGGVWQVTDYGPK